VQAPSTTLSYSQQALWFIYRDAPKSTAYNMALPLRFIGDVDGPTVQQAVQRLVERHTMLRSRFSELDGVPYQYVAADIDHYWQEVDAGGWTEPTLMAELHRHSQQPFVLEQGVFRATLFQGAKTGTVLLLNLHHIAGDAASLAILGKELLAFYTAEDLPPPAMAYGDFVRWEAGLLNSKKGQRMATYWQQRLAGEVPVLQLPTDYPRPQRQTFNGASVRVELPEPLTAAVKNLAKTHNTTLFTVLFSAYQVLLQRYSGQDDIWIGVPTSTPRNQTEFADMVGYLVNPMILRGEFSKNGSPSFSRLIQLNGKQMLTGLYHQPYPFTLLIDRLQPQRNPAYPPLVQAMFALERDDLIPKAFSANGLIAQRLELAQMEGQFDLTLTFSDSDDGKTLSAAWAYNRDLFTEATIARMAEHLHILLQGAADDAEQDISTLPLLTQQDIQHLQAWNDTATDYPQEQTLVDLFERQAATTPDNIAVIFEGQSLTYRQLNEQANQLVRHLLNLKTEAGTPLLTGNPLIAIAVERSLDMVVGLLAILKAGGAYLPIDPDYPSARIHYMLDDSQVPLVLTKSRVQAKVSLDAIQHNCMVLCLDETYVADQPSENMPVRCKAEDLAYVIYTSGSTGMPKGVMVEHKNLINLCTWHIKEFAVQAADKATLLANSAFDASVWELWPYLLTGACVMPASLEALMAKGIWHTLDENNITVSFLPTPIINNASDYPTSNSTPLRLLLTGGDTLHQCPNSLPCPLINNYGPTESTVVTTSAEAKPNELVSIGHPIANTCIYILNSQHQPQPPGIPGELCIAGAGLARGYLHRPELTAEKFVVVELFGKTERLYKTGDLARWLPDGNLEFLGRIDSQIKLRGFRIELGEIEAVLCQHPGINEAVANVYEADGDKRIVAYLTTAQDNVNPDDLRGWLKDRLPDYMAPSHFMRLDALPLTPNGKIDRKALPAPEFQTSSAFSRPATPGEDLLAALWAGVLKREAIGRHDNFFALGGHSLLATQLVARIRDSFQVELPIRAVFEHPQLSALAAAIDAAGGGIRLPAIEPQAADAAKVLSFSQQRLWFLNQFEGNSSATYNMPLALRLSGRLNVEALQQSLHWLLERHASLRSHFPTHAGQAQLQIRPSETIEALSIHDLRPLPTDVREREVLRLTNADAIAPFDLEQGPLFRANLLRLDDSEAGLLLNMHHIVSDGWSMGVFMRDWQHAYAALAEGGEPSLPPLAIHYSDYAAWQRQWLQGDVLHRQIAYWTTQLNGLPELLELPADKPRPPQQSYRGAHFSHHLPATLSQALVRLSRQQSVTLFMTLLAAFDVLLSRYSRQQDICVGSPIANRTHSHSEEVIGFFVNTLVLRGQVDPQHRFIDLLQATRQTCLDAYAHQDIPFEMLVEKLQPTRSLSHSPLFQVMFVLQNNEADELALPDLEVSVVDAEYPIAKFDLTLHVAEQDGQLQCYWEYATDLFNEDTILRMAGHFEVLLQAVADNPEQTIGLLPLLSEREIQQLQAWNDTASDYPQDQTVVDLFERQAAATPDNIAVVFDGRSLSYRQLNEKANQLAHHLLSLKTEERAPLLTGNPLIAIAVERSLDMVVGLLAILKAGGAYLPIDPDYPSARMLDMLDDSATPLLLTKSHTQTRLALTDTTHHCVVLCLDELDVSDRPSNNLAGTAGPQELAYLIYTSGSTGKPKGVMVGHQALTLHSQAILQHYELTEKDRVLQFASLSFDTSLEQLLSAWLSGACSVLLPSNLMPAPDLLALIKTHAITVADLPPAYWQQMLETATLADDLVSLRILILGGEALPYSLAQQTRERFPGLTCFNAYGPTEAAITPCIYRLPPALSGNTPYIAIGKPRANTAVYILNSQHQPQPPGIPGELCIAGAGLARGYLHRPELTAEKFVEIDLFGNSERIYKTGDLARWLPGGNLEFLGRIDSQIKLRGFRIELGEIEAVLCQHPRVNEAVANVYEADGDKRLVAYLTAARDSFNPDDLRGWLKERLPDYMAPSHFMRLDALPLTPNGKIDRKALPAPELQASAGFSPPATPSEDLLATLWAGVLKRESIGRHDNFFERGGHSLLATQLIARIRESFQVELPIRALFEHPELSSLAAAIDAAAGGIRLPAIEAQADDAAKVLSFAQQRLWFLNQFESNNSATYNMPFALRLSGQLDVSALQQSLHWLVERHAALRSHFPNVSGQAQLQIQAIDAIESLSIHDLRPLPTDAREREVLRLTHADVIAPFDLEQGPLFRAALLRLDDNEAVLLLNMHHIVSDGWSMGVLMRDWQHAYAAFAKGDTPSLPPLAIQYSDYAAWQRQWFQGDVLHRQIDYWTQQLDGLPELLELPTDKPRPPRQSYRGAHFVYNLPAALSQAVGQFSVQQDATLFMTLLASFNVLLSRYSRQPDICVGSPIANRTHSHTEDLIGFFINTLVLRNQVEPQQSFIALLQATRQTCLDAYAHQDIPFEMLVETLQPTRSLSHSPLFQVMFVLQNNEAAELALPGLDIASIDIEYPVAKFDLTLHVAEQHGQLQCSWEYATDLFNEDTLQRMAGHFEVLLQAIVDNPEQTIGLLPLLTEQETRQLQAWNDTAAGYPQGRTIVDLFERQVEITPDNIAVAVDGQTLSYRQLNEKANQLARHLRGLKTEAGTALLTGNPLIAIAVERSPDMIIGLLAILKAGGAYVPVDPHYPAIRIRHMLEDSQAPLLLTQSHIKAQLLLAELGHGCVALCLDELDVSGQPTENPAGRSGPEDLAYVIYTSGSTGMPKGVMIEHENLVNLCTWHIGAFAVQQSDKATLLANSAFDASVWELWPYLAAGACVMPANLEVLMAKGIWQTLNENKVSVSFLPTPIINNASDYPASNVTNLRLLLTGGDALHQRPNSLPCPLVNNYGPTEATVVATSTAVMPNGAISIGQPIANTRIYILDAQHQPQPTGIPGELCIAGAGLARGYLGRPELTAEKFIEVELFGMTERIYKTGDLARWLPDGNLEFLGRIDRQIKLRGFRIELGEIEAVLCQYPGIKEAVANLYEGDGNRRIVAYLTQDREDTKDGLITELRSWLKSRLPEHMIPASFTLLDALPLTPNGKIDRKGLPAPDVMLSAKGYAPPSNHAEQKIAAAWRDVLKREQIGIHDSFFELGGHSLLVIQVLGLLQQDYPQLKVVDLFSYPTVSALAGYLEQAAAPQQKPDSRLRGEKRRARLATRQQK